MAALALTAALGCGGGFTTVGEGVDGSTDTSTGADDGSGSSSGGPGPDGATSDGAPPIDEAGATGDASDSGLTVDAGCPRGIVTFNVRPSATSGKQYCGAGGCGSEWFTIHPVGGGPALPIDGGCVTMCADCEPIACAIECPVATVLSPTGATREWDGTLYPPSTCGPSALACVGTSCAAPGKYVATMCGRPQPASDAAYPLCTSATTTSTTPTCVDVPFDWPPPASDGTNDAGIPVETVTGTLD
jgi:hypothetical protein